MLLACVGTTASAQTYPYQDPNLSAEERANDLCGRLTLEEKAKLMVNNSEAIDRLGIPYFPWWNEALHGVGRNGLATVFPATIGMAASFDNELLLDVFTAVSDEARAKNTYAKHTNSLAQNRGVSFWTPNINIFRDPRWGRGQETYGEDPYLTSVMGLSVVRGLQGPSDSRYKKLLACAKHFVVHSGPEWSRHQFNLENLPSRDLYETYLPAFKTLVKEGDVAEVMCAYHRMDGKPCCGNSQLLNHLLRTELGFKGLVTSDCGAIDDFWSNNGHGFSLDKIHAASQAVAAGTDLECGYSNYISLPEAVKKGLVTEEQINTSLKRLLVARFEVGDFDDDSLVEWTKIPMSVVGSKAHNALALKMAHETMTLLQNKGNILPLNRNARIVVLGENAVDSTMLWGNYNGFPSHTVTILEGILKKANNVTYIPGCGLTKTDNTDYVKATADADVVIFVGGLSPKLEGEEMPSLNEPGFKKGDRTTIELPEAQRTLLARLHAANRRIVFVNCSGSAVGLVPETSSTDAILQAWYGGEEGGTAVADVLFGDYNPSGKLPVTFYKNTEQLPPYEDYSMKGRTYRYFTGQPLFPFGYGLSYTTFKVGKPRYNASKGQVVVNVKNTGMREGDTTVQIYIRRPDDKNGPIKTLRGFKRVHLRKGERKKVVIDMPKERFASWDETTNTMRVLPGDCLLMAGTSSDINDLCTIKVKL